jgi:hypothetical protein
MSPVDNLRFEPGSFRDPAARVLWHHGTVYRYLSAEALHNWERLSSTRFFRRFTDAGSLIPTERTHDVQTPPFSTPWVAALRHDTVPVISYPYEWCFGMLRDAALLQLDLLSAALEEGMTLKDATPFNVQWIGARPVFIDVGSFAVAEPGAAWGGYRQFCEMYLYPLFLQAYKNVPFHPWLRGSLEGIDARTCNRLLSVRDWFRRGVFAHVYLLSKFQSRYESTDRNVGIDLRAAGFGIELVKNNVRRLRRLVERLEWNQSRSAWSDYAQSNTYDRGDQDHKQQFVRQATGHRRWSLVWDLGCNTGDYARIAADHANCVVALDADHLAVERLYRTLKAERNSAILPLVGDVTDPTPGLGWRGVERRTLLDRGRPELVLALALIHHLALSRNIPVPDLIDWFASLRSDLVVEFVAPDDPMSQRLLRHKGGLDFGYTQDSFERYLSRHFTVLRVERLGSGTRTMYHARPTGSA